MPALQIPFYHHQPKMVVEDITIKPMVVPAIRDTAASMADTGPVLGKNYGEM